MSTFIIIDGNAIMHRAYHAYPPLTKGYQPVGAVYGFFSMLFKLIEDMKPQYFAVCFDRPKPTFRQALFAGYQQNRPGMTDDLASQIGLIHQVLEKGRVQVFEVDGYEADDLIGTLAVQAVRGPAASAPSKHSVRAVGNPSSGVTPFVDQVIIVSGDRDMLQLVNHKVKVLMPLIGITKTILFDKQKVEEKYGVKPAQFIDYKALIGDASDGYPGVTGIGPKTAAKLIREFDNFEHLYRSLDKIPEGIAQKLATDAEQAALAKKLATIDINAPITLHSETCSLEHFDSDGVKTLFKDLDFNSLLNRFPKYLEELTRKKKDEQLGLL